MTRNPVMNLWTALVSAFLTLCTSLGLITTTAAAVAVPEAQAARNLNVPQNTTAHEEPIRVRPRTDSLPPTMKQRIHAEAHGSSPSCRHRPPTDTAATDTTATAAVTAAHDSIPAPGAATRATTASDCTEAVPPPVGAKDFPGPTRRTTGVIGGGPTRAVPAANPAVEPNAVRPARTPAVARTSTPDVTPTPDATPATATATTTVAPITDETPVVLTADEAPVVLTADEAPTVLTADEAPVAPAAGFLPAQSSTSTSTPAPASAPARVLTGAGAATQG